jgi:hypothetical protein
MTTGSRGGYSKSRTSFFDQGLPLDLPIEVLYNKGRQKEREYHMVDDMIRWSPAEKAGFMKSALEELRQEYNGRPDIVYTIERFLGDAAPPVLALLFDLVKQYPTKEQALERLGVKAHG